MFSTEKLRKSFKNDNTCNNGIYILIFVIHTICLDYTWMVCDDIFGSKYFPIILENLEPNDENCSHEKLHRANWKEF